MIVESEEKILPFSDDGLFDQRKSQDVFNDFWARAKHRIPEMLDLDAALENFQMDVYQVKKTLSEFRYKLRSIPALVSFGYWVRAISSEIETAKRHIEHLQILFEKKIIPLIQNDRVVTLEDLGFIGHQNIVEEIRCIKSLTIFEREDLVKSYISFSHFLARSVFNIIPHGFDPDRDRVRNREIKYEAFLDFVQYLPLRDGLIAKLLYFGAPSIEEVLSLKLEQINLHPNLNQIHFSKTVAFPRHLIRDVAEFARSHSLPLALPNAKGRPVERAHLNQSFGRASKKAGTKITPGLLLKWKSEGTNMGQ